MDISFYKQLLQKKPPVFVGITIGYLLISGLLKWKISPPIDAIWYLVGGICGIFFLDIAEVFFKLNPSPFRTILFQILFTFAAFFIITSSGSMLASGLVLSVFLTMLLWQYGEISLSKNLHSWYRLFATPVQPVIQIRICGVFSVVFLVLSFLLVR